jgi:anti-sigma-K factor RskA
MALTSAPAHAKVGVGAAPAPVLQTVLFRATRGLHFAAGHALLRTGDRLTVDINLVASNVALAKFGLSAVIGDQTLQIWAINPNALPVQIGILKLVGGKATTVITPLPMGVPLVAGTTIAITRAGADPVLMPLASGTF